MPVKVDGTFQPYLIWCEKLGMGYVGITSCTLEARLKQHRSNGGLLKNAIREHGIDAFSIRPLGEPIVGLRAAMDAEGEFTRQHNTIRPYGFNVTVGGSRKPRFHELGYARRFEWVERKMDWVWIYIPISRDQPYSEVYR